MKKIESFFDELIPIITVSGACSEHITICRNSFGSYGITNRIVNNGAGYGVTGVRDRSFIYISIEEWVFAVFEKETVAVSKGCGDSATLSLLQEFDTV